MIFNKKHWMLSAFAMIALASINMSSGTDERDAGKTMQKTRTDQKDVINTGLRKALRDLIQIRDGIKVGRSWNELIVAVLLEVYDYAEFGRTNLEYPAVKKIRNYKNISHILIMLVVERYEKKGCLHYGFVYKDEDFYNAAMKIHATDPRSFRIDLNPSNDKREWLSGAYVQKSDVSGVEAVGMERHSLRWLSGSTYKLQLSAPGGAVVSSSGYGDGTLMLVARDNVTSFEFGTTEFGIPTPGYGLLPDSLAKALLDYSMRDFQMRKNGKVSRWYGPE
jgi:hypothetical protein